LKPVVRYEEEIAPSVSMPFTVKILLSKGDTPTASVRLSMLNKNMKIDLHTHNECDQIEYCMRGKAVMFIEGLGEKEIREGTFTYVPKGVKHSIVKVIEPFTVLTVFVPPLF
jgi:quercetin dioxygenase-like cupin family protein